MTINQVKTEDEKTVRAIVASIPALASYHGPIARLGGLTNKVYQLGDRVLRIAGAGTEEYINRAHEAEAARIAAEAGVSPSLLYVDSASGVMVTQLIANATTMTPASFKSRPYAAARAGEALKRLHQSGGIFPFRFELFAMIDEYLKVLSTKDVALPMGYHGVVRQAQNIRTVLAKNPAPLAPCHCDPLCENFIDTGDRMWIVDWEYSGMNDPMWDLGDLSVEGSFDEAQDHELLQAYFSGPPSPADHGRMVIYKAMCDLLWTLWGLIQLANKNPADDFSAYADGRFARCKALMAEPAFAAHVAAVEIA
ncbi:MAG: phosphotransferase family protein [Alphaproteobacteria bacterium]|nr:phosphotransferase family protein [Alphaproteobacteria bacterium]